MKCPNRQELLVSADELAAMLEDRTLRIIDCRFDLTDPAAGREAYQDAHIPGAVYADLDHDLAAPVDSSTGRHPLPDFGSATETFRRLGICRDSNVIVYDSAGGAMAARAWWMLRWLGHDRVRLLDGGFPTWHSGGYATEPGAVTTAAGDFMGTPVDGRILTTMDLVAAMTSATALRVVDARDAARFRGEVEPIDAIAGHIPGTLNQPFTDALDANGTFKTGAALTLMWRDKLGDDPDVPWSVMCGSGVTACHLVISALLAGYREPSLYVGSWSEWIRDPGRPVASGPV
jgi:thiosulfate/3-mercaptopyruvate sulfurtransferase